MSNERLTPEESMGLLAFIANISPVLAALKNAQDPNEKSAGRSFDASLAALLALVNGERDLTASKRNLLFSQVALGIESGRFALASGKRPSPVEVLSQLSAFAALVDEEGAKDQSVKKSLFALLRAAQDVVPSKNAASNT